MSYRSASSLCHKLPKPSKLCIQIKSLCVILLKKFDVLIFKLCYKSEKMAITRLANATGLQTLYHLIAKDKVP